MTNYYQNGYSPHVSAEMQNAMQLDFSKKQNSVAAQIEIAHQKAFMREEELERKKALCEVVSFGENGKLTIQTKNTRMDTKARQLTNFDNPFLIQIRSLGNPLDYIFLFRCSVNGKNAEVALDGKKVGSSTYIIKKLSSIGAVIYASSESAKKTYAQTLWSFLLSHCCDKAEVPNEHGWYRTKDGEILFYEKGGLTWLELKNYAK